MTINDTAQVIECTNAEYHARDELSRSQGNLLVNDMHLLFEAQVIKKSFRPEPTEAKIEGQHFHAFLFEPDTILEIPEEVLSSSGSKAGKAWKEFEAEHEGKYLLKKAELAWIKSAVLAIHDHDMANELLFSADRKEMTIIWQDPKTGVWLRVRLDAVHKHAIADAKSTRHDHISDFCRDISKLNYDFQAFMYQEGFFQLTGERPPFVFVPVKKPSKSDPTIAVEAVELDEGYMEIGRRKFDKMLREYVRCTKERRWRKSTHGQVIKVSPTRFQQTDSWSM